MNKRIQKKLSDNVLRKYRRNGYNLNGLEYSRPEAKLMRSVAEVHRQRTSPSRTEETWEERINRIDSYKFANPTPIKVHKSPTVWGKIKNRIKEWLK